MKKSITITASLFAFALMSFMGPKHTDVYKVDTKLSSLEWIGEKVSGKHSGTIKLSSGEIHSDHGTLTGKFDIDMTSVANTDMEAGEYRTKLEDHLKAPDFFDAAKYPKSTFVVTSVTPIKDAKEGGMTHKVKGNLTVKDKTNEISFDSVIKTEGGKIACVGTAIVDRTKYDIKYGSKSFFPEIGDKMIYDDFKLKFNVVAIKK